MSELPDNMKDIVESDKSAEELMEEYNNGGIKSEEPAEEPQEEIQQEIPEEETPQEDIPSEHGEQTLENPAEETSAHLEDQPLPPDNVEQSTTVTDIFSQLNKLNNPDGVDVPDGQVPYRDNGETKFASIEETNRMLHMGKDYTKKTQALAKEKMDLQEKFGKFEEVGVSEDDLAIVKLFKEGNVSDAMKAAAKTYNMNSDSLFEHANSIEDSHIQSYQIPEIKQKNSVEYSPEVSKLFGQFDNDFSTTVKTTMKQLPPAVEAAIGANPQLAHGFASDIASGDAFGYMQSIEAELSQLNAYQRQVVLTSPDEYFKLYANAHEQKHGAIQPEPPAQEQIIPTNSNTERQLTDDERAVRNRLNPGTHVVDQNKSIPTPKENVSKILNDDGYVDELLAKKYGIG